MDEPWHKIFSIHPENALIIMKTTAQAHSYFDYAYSVFLMLSPWLLGFGEGGAETLSPVLAGMVLILYSFFTDYKGGLYRRIAYSVHLAFDMLLGIFIATSPWFFNFDEDVYRPHLLMGCFLFVVALLSFNLVSFKKLHLRHQQSPAV